jgi:uncharacterized protein (TIRG00374 family)
MDPQITNRQPLKKWLTFAVRWGIAVAGIALVLWKMSFHDRVRVLDPATNTIQMLRVVNDARDADLAFSVVPARGGAPVTVRREDLWVRPDRKSVSVRFPDGNVRSVTLIGIKPGETTGAGRSVRELLVDDPDSDSDRGLRITPDALAGVNDLTVSSPYVEIGVNRLVREADRKYLLAAVFIIPLSFLLTSIRWHLLLESLEIRLSPFRTFVLNCVGAFYNAFMPGTTGGDLVKAYYASRHTTHRTRAVLSVIIDRIIGLLALFIVGGTMAAYQWHIPDCRRVAVASWGVLACVAAGCVVFYSRLLRRFTGLDFILRRLPMQRHVAKVVEAMEIYRHRPLPILMALLLSFPVHITAILSATFAGWAFGLKMPVFYYWVVVPVIALVGAVPISPQGIGVMEAFAVELTRRHGVSIGQAFALTMSIRLVQIVWNLVAGVFVFRGGYHAPSEKEQRAMESDEGGPASIAQGREPDRAGPIGAQPRPPFDNESSAGPSVLTGLAESRSLPRVNDAAPQSEP